MIEFARKAVVFLEAVCAEDISITAIFFVRWCLEGGFGSYFRRLLMIWRSFVSSISKTCQKGPRSRPRVKEHTQQDVNRIHRGV